MNSMYTQQVEMLLRTIPFISHESCFAIHGGTAINLFVKDLPRYSIDIDLTNKFSGCIAKPMWFLYHCYMAEKLRQPYQGSIPEIYSTSKIWMSL